MKKIRSFNQACLFSEHDLGQVNDLAPVVTIGRVGGKGVVCDRTTPLGNPFKIGRWGRIGAILMFKTYFDKRKLTSPIAGCLCELLKEVREKGSVRLLCHCAPLRCHTEVIRDLLLYYIDKGIYLYRYPFSDEYFEADFLLEDEDAVAAYLSQENAFGRDNFDPEKVTLPLIRKGKKIFYSWPNRSQEYKELRSAFRNYKKMDGDGHGIIA